MLEPLKEFICDTCKQKIKDPKDGMIEWTAELDEGADKYVCSDFKIVHGAGATPDCAGKIKTKSYRDDDLTEYLNQDGSARMLTFLDKVALANMPQLGELLRRLTVPHYEEAKQYWNDAMADGCFDGLDNLSQYSQKNLKEIISKYAKS